MVPLKGANNKNEMQITPKTSAHKHCWAIRLIADSKRALDKNTRFRPSEIDDLRQYINKITPYTANGFIISMDISEVSHSFGSNQNLWPCFCLLKPQLGPVHYTCMAQGWKCSPQFCWDNLLII